jgi:hypothetical protein
MEATHQQRTDRAGTRSAPVPRPPNVPAGAIISEAGWTPVEDAVKAEMSKALLVGMSDGPSRARRRLADMLPGGSSPWR